ncbi:hypothetical protein BLNAU_4593 [Blattamonas nauphoetae]|uniref:Nucleoprotein TPR n=1 Tax=Blattamonas nauphoetae TaxID=2049346 RepID=A0ABQ9Y9F4_9EUKA|nr:hypothetical protein BLNAU_4593 [Blattamonas nauphoetae]
MLMEDVYSQLLVSTASKLRLEREKGEVESELHNSASELDKIVRQLDTCQKENIQLNNKLEQQNSKIEQMDDALLQKDHMIDELQKETESKRETIRTSNSSLEALKTSLETIQTQLRETKEENTALSSQVAEITKQLHTTQQERENVQNELLKRESEIRTWDSERAELMGSLESVQNDNKTMKADIQEIADMIGFEAQKTQDNSSFLTSTSDEPNVYELWMAQLKQSDSFIATPSRPTELFDGIRISSLAAALRVWKTGVEEEKTTAVEEALSVAVELKGEVERQREQLSEMSEMLRLCGVEVDEEGTIVGSGDGLIDRIREELKHCESMRAEEKKKAAELVRRMQNEIKTQLQEHKEKDEQLLRLVEEKEHHLEMAQIRIDEKEKEITSLKGVLDALLSSSFQKRNEPVPATKNKETNEEERSVSIMLLEDLHSTIARLFSDNARLVAIVDECQESLKDDLSLLNEREQTIQLLTIENNQKSATLTKAKKENAELQKRLTDHQKQLAELQTQTGQELEEHQQKIQELIGVLAEREREIDETWAEINKMGIGKEDSSMADVVQFLVEKIEHPQTPHRLDSTAKLARPTIPLDEPVTLEQTDHSEAKQVISTPYVKKIPVDGLHTSPASPIFGSPMGQSSFASPASFGETSTLIISEMDEMELTVHRKDGERVEKKDDEEWTQRETELLQTIQRLEDDLVQADEQIAVLKDRCEQMATQQETLIQEKQHLNETVQHLSDQQRRTESLLIQSQSEQSSNQTSQHTLIETLNKKISQLEKDRSLTASERQMLVEEKLKMAEENTRVLSQIGQVKHQLGMISSDLNTTQARYFDLVEDFDAALASEREAHDQMKKLTRNIQSHSDTISALRQKTEKQQSEIQTLKESQARWTAEGREGQEVHERTLTELGKKLKEAESELELVSAEKTEMETVLRNLVEESEQTKEQLKEKDKSLKLCESDLRVLQRQNSELLAQLKEPSRGIELPSSEGTAEELGRLSKLKAALERRVMELTKELKNKETEIWYMMQLAGIDEKEWREEYAALQHEQSPLPTKPQSPLKLTIHTNSGPSHPQPQEPISTPPNPSHQLSSGRHPRVMFADAVVVDPSEVRALTPPQSILKTSQSRTRVNDEKEKEAEKQQEQIVKAKSSHHHQDVTHASHHTRQIAQPPQTLERTIHSESLPTMLPSGRAPPPRKRPRRSPESSALLQADHPQPASNKPKR